MKEDKRVLEVAKCILKDNLKESYFIYTPHLIDTEMFLNECPKSYVDDSENYKFDIRLTEPQMTIVCGVNHYITEYIKEGGFLGVCKTETAYKYYNNMMYVWYYIDGERFEYRTTNKEVIKDMHDTLIEMAEQREKESNIKRNKILEDNICS